MPVNGDMVFAQVSAQVSAGDGKIYSVLTVQPPPMPTLFPPLSANGTASVSAPNYDMLEFIRRTFTHITSPSCTVQSGGSAGSVQIGFGTGPSGIVGMIQGVPFMLSGAGERSGSPTSAGCSTTSTQIRKVLVTLSLAIPSSISGNIASGAGTLNFVYGSAFTTSAMACTSGSQTISYWDYVPLPQASAGEIPIGWINCPNSFNASSMLVNSCLNTDYRVTQGINLSAMMATVLQP